MVSTTSKAFVIWPSSLLNDHISRAFLRSIVLALLVALLAFAFAQSASSQIAGAWPAITREQRPWAYWWWMGSAVDRTNLSRELTRYHDAGYGGVHIIPIYGAKGWESNYISYLSPRWIETLKFTVAEANRLDLGVDMTTGTGWCFGGGPNVTEAEGNANVVVKTFDVSAGKSLTEKFDPKKTHALMAFSLSPSDAKRAEVRGSAVDLTKKIRADGSVDWTPKSGAWKVYAISQKFSGQKVKRPSPGGEGPMLNLLYPDAMKKFLQPFTDAFAKYDSPKPRAQYHDSYEYKTDWSPDFFAQFEKRRGYKLQNELPALFGKDGSDHAARVLCDYRETVSDIMAEDTLPQWVKWSHNHGFITRNEAHGSPGNLLDFYALADVPETEMFNRDRNKLISKFASSAAHVAGRKLVGSETGTWLKEHFTETLADMKWLADDLFLSGVNHIFYHGTCYSPDEAGWPGWVFYASYEMNPRNAVWHDARALNDYVARCQSVLQSGKPDNDILLYWPIHDFWSQFGGKLLPHLTVHARDWFEAQPVGKLAEQLWNRGYQFDYVSDRQLAAGKAVKTGVQVAGGTYRAIVVPPCDLMPLATLEELSALAKSGVPVIFSEHLPQDVSGWGDLEKRRGRFQKLLAGLGSRVLCGDIEASLAKAQIAREALVDHAGLLCIRRANAGGHDYFIANRGEKPVDGWIRLATAPKSAALMDPLRGQIGVAAARQSAANEFEVLLQLAPGESVIVHTLAVETANAPAWQYVRSETPAAELRAQWRVEFLSGGPTLPATFTANQLFSWTEAADDAAKSFSGTARYSATFDAPGSESHRQAVQADPLKRELQTYVLDLGKVVQSARVRLNGKSFGSLIMPPFRVVVDNLKPASNQIEIEVTSTSANRIRDLDRRGVKWQNFNDINFVNQDYRPFNAANWPVADAGLLGPVTLTPLKEITP